MSPDRKPDKGANPGRPVPGRDRIGRTILGLLIALALFFSPFSRVPGLDSSADDYFEKAISKAGLVYATCRVINASVSLIKDSSVQVQPAGVGMTLAVGQVLDPIDDLTERLSDLMVTAIVSLGIQKLAFEISLGLAPPLLAIILALLTLLSWWPTPRLALLQRTLSLLFLLFLAARFCLPLAAMANRGLDRHFFAPRIEQARNDLALYSAELENLKKFSFPETDSLLGAIGSSGAFLKFKSAQFKNALVATVSNAGAIIDNQLKLAALYAGIFLIQVLFLPLAIFWLLLRLANSLAASAMAGPERIPRNPPAPSPGN